MTDSMKFGPEWLRNMSAEPSLNTHGGNSSTGNSSTGSSNFAHNNNSGQGGAAVSHAPTPRNMFPEFRYGREEMLSLFDRNCVLPQILPSYKKLFIEKVQYPLALTPSSEDEITTQGPTSSSSRPSWIQRSPISFGNSSRGTGRGGTIDRGRLRPLSLKPERNWNERNGTNESSISVGGGIGCGNGGSGVSSGSNNSLGMEWGDTISSSPRREFSSQNRWMVWRRNRNEGGSNDRPNCGGNSSNALSTDGWRSGSGNSSVFGTNHRWARSTSWRDEETIPSNSSANDNTSTSYGGGISMQRSFSTVGNVGNERIGSGIYSGSNLSKTAIGGTSITNRTSQVGKGNQQWNSGGGSSSRGANSGAPDAEDNLPEWAMENPSDVGGTFDASGAFLGESGTDEETRKEKISSNAEPDIEDISIEPSKVIDDNNQEIVTIDENDSDKQKAAVTENVNVSTESVESNTIRNNSDCEQSPQDTTAEIIPTESEVKLKDDQVVEKELNADNVENLTKAETGDISERMKAVADEVEKLIMDDEVGDIQSNGNNEPIDGMGTNGNSGGGGAFVSPAVGIMLKHTAQQQQLDSNRTETVSPTRLTAASLTQQQQQQHKSLPFAEQLTIQQHIQQQQQHQHQLATANVLPPHVLNPSSSDLWFYRDPQSNIQGPFSALEMTEWYRAGYFNENLYVRRLCDNRFRPLGELIKLCHGNMPFTQSHILPPSLELDAMQISANKVQLSEQQRNEEQQLKGNVTAVADALSAALKNPMNSMGISHLLTMRFQLLQEQYMQHQENHILNELAKNEVFQRLPLAEREAIVQQKVQMLTLPDYLSSLNGFSNSLSVIDPMASSQLYDAIAQQAKKQQQQLLFSANNGQHPQRIEADDFILNAQLLHQQTQQQQQHQQSHQTQQFTGNHFRNTPEPKLGRDDIGGRDLINELNFRMFLQGSGIGIPSQQPQPQQTQPKSNPTDFINEPQLLTSAVSAAGAGQNLMMPIWLPQYTASGQSQQQPQQNQMLTPQQLSQWGANGLPSVVGLTSVEGNSTKPLSGALWDCAVLEEAQNQQLLQKRHQQNMLENNINNINYNDAQEHQQEMQQQQQQQQQQHNNKHKEQDANVQQLQQETKQKKDEIILKHNNKPQQQQQASSNGRAKQLDGKNSEEDRRREQAEEKRRQKEERKRQQLEDEKRRAHAVEEEKRRQLQEEKERQQQIQAHRRKAHLSGAVTSTTVSNQQTNKTVNTKVSGTEQQRSHSTSIAPWSLQKSIIQNAGPTLAEIQKAERRERRADLQRQQEQLDKQLRANAAAAAEANDVMLRWQASPAPTTVMSLAEIQAEEAKRLTSEQLEQQRRREQEQQRAQSTAAANFGIGISNIWGNPSVAKAWSGTTNSTGAAGFWEESSKFSATTSNVTNTTAATIPTSNMQPINSRQQQSKSSNVAATNSVSPTSRNLRKSQTVPAMQSNNATAATVRNSKSGNNNNINTNQEKNKSATHKSQKSCDDKKSNSKQSNNGVAQNKASEYENEFTSWCTKSLVNMSAKVDVPTFVTFLQDLEAPYEVKDYVRMYLGEGKESTDFAKQFLERRSKYKNLQRAQNAHNDDMCKPAPAITPSGNDNTDNKNKQKKVKKNKMTKLDARILGFSVTAAEGRINVGDRDYVDGP